MVDPDIWTVHRVISAPLSDGGKACIPALKHKQGEVETLASTNTEKSKVLAKSFFLTKPPHTGIPTDYNYPSPCCKPNQLTREQIMNHLHRLKPYKAPGPDGIPSVILTKCTDLLTERLYFIYKIMLEQSMHYKPWKTFVMVILCKPGKPRYDIPKAYRPIALLNTMWKVFTAIIAKQLTFYSEKFQLLPANHFGSRPEHTTMDAIHLSVHKIKSS